MLLPGCLSDAAELSGRGAGFDLEELLLCSDDGFMRTDTLSPPPLLPDLRPVLPEFRPVQPDLGGALVADGRSGGTYRSDSTEVFANLPEEDPGLLAVYAACIVANMKPEVMNTL